MAFEERELSVSPEAPLVGWRLFRVLRDDVGPLLCAPMYHDPASPSWPERARTATCANDHDAPDAECRCGIYAVIRGTLDSLPGYLLDTAHRVEPWGYAEVACSGRVFVDHRGIRAEHGELVRLAIAESSWPGLEAAADDAEGLRQRYGVPVGGLESVPEWVTGNLQPQGKPPEDATLDLDDLDLPWPQ